MHFQLDMVDYERKRMKNVHERKMFFKESEIESKKKAVQDCSVPKRKKVVKKAKNSGPTRKSNRIKFDAEKENIEPQCLEKSSENIQETREKPESIPESPEKVEPNSMSIYEFKFQNFEIGNLHLKCSSFAHPTASLEHFDK